MFVDSLIPSFRKCVLGVYSGYWRHNNKNIDVLDATGGHNQQMSNYDESSKCCDYEVTGVWGVY